jgi:hypothetical protein
MKKRPLLVLVTGSREWSNRRALWDVLESLNPEILINGQATGADRLSSDWARAKGVDLIEVPALFKAKGKSAGTHRNGLMFAVALALASRRSMNLVVVAAPLPNSVGTRNAIGLAVAAHVKIVEVKP